MRPEACALNCGIRPRSTRFATSPVMNTVFPARDSPVTPSRKTDSNSGPSKPPETLSKPRTSPSAKSAIPTPNPFSCLHKIGNPMARG